MDLAIRRSATAAVAAAVVATGLIGVTAPPGPFDLQVPTVQLSAATFDDVSAVLDLILSQSQDQVTAAISDLTSGDLANALWTGTAGSLNALVAAPGAAFVGTVNVLLGEPGVTVYVYPLAEVPPVDLGEVFTDVQNDVGRVASFVSDGLTNLLGGDVQNGLAELVWGLTGQLSYIPWDLFLGPLAVLLAMF